MEWAEQHSVLTSFGEGRSNLLIATSVVEEGLDVQVRPRSPPSPSLEADLPR